MSRSHVLGLVAPLLLAALASSDEGPAECGRPEAAVRAPSLLQIRKSQERQAAPARRGLSAVLVIKIHGAELESLRQALCLVTRAYNAKARRDVVVFSDLAVPEGEVRRLQDIASPASLEVVHMNPTPQSVLASLSSAARRRVEEACKAPVGEITFETVCGEKGSPYKAPMSYLIMNWFRIVQLWTHPRLAKYDYMLQMDSDAFCTKPWDRDPIEVLAERNLTYIFNTFPGLANYVLTKGMRRLSTQVFGRPMCKVELEDGHLLGDTTSCGPGPFPDSDNSALSIIWGSFQVARLSFFRGQAFQKWARRVAEDGYIFTRRWDDQTAMTIALVELAPEASYLLSALGFDLGIFHNGYLNGEEQDVGFVDFVKKSRQDGGFALEGCQDFILVPGLLSTSSRLA